MRIAAVALAALAAASCAPRPAPPAPLPPPRPVPPPPAPAPAPLPPADWRDAPLSPGDWSYAEGPAPRAAFGAEGPVFAVECMPDRRIRLSRTGAASASSPVTIRTTYGERALAATLAPSDPLLDEMVFSRGRFLVQAEAAPDLILPAWPEIARVVEECRG